MKCRDSKSNIMKENQNVAFNVFLFKIPFDKREQITGMTQPIWPSSFDMYPKCWHSITFSTVFLVVMTIKFYSNYQTISEFFVNFHFLYNTSILLGKLENQHERKAHYEIKLRRYINWKKESSNMIICLIGYAKSNSINFFKMFW